VHNNYKEATTTTTAAAAAVVALSPLSSSTSTTLCQSTINELGKYQQDNYNNSYKASSNGTLAEAIHKSFKLNDDTYEYTNIKRNSMFNQLSRAMTSTLNPSSSLGEPKQNFCTTFILTTFRL
jgi:hypothetical protein